MIAYNKTWLENSRIQEELENMREEAFISQDEWERLKKAYPVGFYTPHFFIALGLFLLTIVIVMASFGLFSLLFLPDGRVGSYAVAAIFMGLASYFLLEWIARKGHFRSGVDTGLVWMAGLLILGGINVLTNLSPLNNACLIGLLSFYFMLRFIDGIMAIISFISLLAIFFLVMEKLGAWPGPTTPFLLMFISALVYRIVQGEILRKKFPGYGSCLLLIEIASLVCFYLAANYYVVREGTALLYHADTMNERGIALGWFFWILTIFLPLFYLGWGIRKKDLVLIRVGLILCAATVFTIRYYYHIIPVEWALLSGGILLISGASLLIRFLKEPKYGFTSRDQLSGEIEGKKQLEALLAAGLMGAITTDPVDSSPKFGGGTGSGGGAGGSY